MCRDVYYTYDCGHRIGRFPAYRETGTDATLPGGPGPCFECRDTWKEEKAVAKEAVAPNTPRKDGDGGFWKRTAQRVVDVAGALVASSSPARTRE
ncbi:hypothetical protein CSOJ01_14601 [Colletotrichum sojae]|uniref:Uncharacterized protein n=1 Tax=Colletotrichum sojae TaxID=2175907 RepID=A0A8H6MJN6_9PEZI|nr:hypothetical protein CSOJ01_14601 [Colletotrichum sojae]